MSRKILYKKDLPELSSNTITAKDSKESNVTLYLKTLLHKLHETAPQDEWLLPSINEIAEKAQTSKDEILEGLRNLKEKDGVNLGIQSGYYGGITLHPATQS